MATPNYATVLSQINAFIVANGNNEITANVLNPILKLILDFANNNIGDLSELITDEDSTVVEAINSLKNNFNDLINKGVQLYQGYDNPNDTPPATYKYADFYMQLDSSDDSPIYLWQWNGFQWVTDMVSGSEIVDFPRLTEDQQIFEIPAGKIAKSALVNYANYVPETENNLDEVNTFTQDDVNITFKETLKVGNYVVINI